MYKTLAERAPEIIAWYQAVAVAGQRMADSLRMDALPEEER